MRDCLSIDCYADVGTQVCHTVQQLQSREDTPIRAARTSIAVPAGPPPMMASLKGRASEPGTAFAPTMLQRTACVFGAQALHLCAQWPNIADVYDIYIYRLASGSYVQRNQVYKLPKKSVTEVAVTKFCATRGVCGVCSELIPGVISALERASTYKLHFSEQRAGGEVSKKSACVVYSAQLCAVLVHVESADSQRTVAESSSALCSSFSSMRNTSRNP
jgi:hypothetical protein